MKKVLSQKQYELNNLKFRKRKQLKPEKEKPEGEEPEGEEPEVEELEGEEPEEEKPEEELIENDKITELENQLDTYKMEYASDLLERVGIGGENPHALSLIDMTSKDTIYKDVERLVEIAKTFKTGTYSKSDNLNDDSFGHGKPLSEEDVMKKTFGLGKWRGKTWQ